MHAAVCGFAHVEQPILKVLQKIAYELDDGSNARTVKAIPGGWGAAWLSVNNLICLSKQTLLEGTEAAIPLGN